MVVVMMAAVMIKMMMLMAGIKTMVVAMKRDGMKMITIMMVMKITMLTVVIKMMIITFIRTCHQRLPASQVYPQLNKKMNIIGEHHARGNEGK